MAKKDKEAPKDDKEKDAKADEKDAKGGKGAKGDEAAAEGAEGEAAPKKSKKKLIIIVVGVLILLGGIAAGLILTGVVGGGDKKETSKGKDGKKKDSKDSKDGAEDETKYAKDKDGKVILDKDGKPVKAKPIFYDMPDIIVNLNSPSPRPHFVNLKLTLEIASEGQLEDVKAQLPRITDSFNTYLREIRREDLQGSAGSYRLKKELTLRLNKILGDGVVNDILFKEIIVQ